LGMQVIHEDRRITVLDAEGVVDVLIDRDLDELLVQAKDEAKPPRVFIGFAGPYTIEAATIAGAVDVGGSGRSTHCGTITTLTLTSPHTSLTLGGTADSWGRLSVVPEDDEEG
jgi:hypothetical protein